jgi:hypothetical protein
MTVHSDHRRSCSDPDTCRSGHETVTGVALWKQDAVLEKHVGRARHKLLCVPLSVERKVKVMVQFFYVYKTQTNKQECFRFFLLCPLVHLPVSQGKQTRKGKIREIPIQIYFPFSPDKVMQDLHCWEWQKSSISVVVVVVVFFFCFLFFFFFISLSLTHWQKNVTWHSDQKMSDLFYAKWEMSVIIIAICHISSY